MRAEAVAELRSWRVADKDYAAAMHARRAFARYLRAIALPAASDLLGAELIFGELVANGVEHGTGAVVLTLSREGHDLVLSMPDTGGWADRAFATARPEPGQLRGRGLFFVRSIARSVDRNRFQKQVRVLLPARLDLKGLLESSPSGDAHDQGG